MSLRLADLLFALARGPRTLRTYSTERKQRRRMRQTPRFAIAELPENTIGKLVGRVRPSSRTLLEAPLSGRLCVYYEVSIDAMSGPTLVRVLATENEGMEFMLDDGTARCFVDPAHAEISTGIDFVSRSNLRLHSDRQHDLIVRHHLSGVRLRSADSLRFREGILECDETIAVVGGGVRDTDPEATRSAYRDENNVRLCLTGTPKNPLLISDDPRALT